MFKQSLTQCQSEEEESGIQHTLQKDKHKHHNQEEIQPQRQHQESSHQRIRR